MLNDCFFAPMKNIALSESIRCGEPRRAMNLQRAVTQLSVVRLFVVSKCIARVAKHVNKQIYRFIVDEFLAI